MTMSNLTMNPLRLGTRAATVAAVAGLALSAAAFAVPAVASATPATQTYDIWNLTSTDIKVTGYEKPASYKMVPKENLPTDTVIPIGKNLQITVSEGYGVIADLSGAQPAQQGGTQTWQVSTLLESGSEFLPVPMVHMACIPADGRNAACGVSSGSNVKSLADAPGTKIAVPASDVQTQHLLLANLCNHPYAKTLQIKCFDFAGEKNVTAGNTVWTWPGGR